MFFVAGFILLVVLSNLLAAPLRRRRFRALAERYGLTFVPLIKVPQLAAVSSALKYHAAKARSTETSSPGDGAGGSDRDADIGIKGPALPDGSVLQNERFFNVLKTAQIRNLCFGTYQGLHTEIFDHRRARERDERSGNRNRTETTLAFRLPDRNLPAFLIRPLIRASDRDDPNVVPQCQLPDFDQTYLINSDNHGAPDEIASIQSLLDSEVLRTLVPHRGMRVRAVGDAVIISKGSIQLKPGEIPDLLDAGCAFVKALANR
jgi:hypothetical protein